MTTFILSVIGICALGVLVDVIVPSGQTNKYVKGVFSIFTVIAIISPASEMLGLEKINFGDYQNSYHIADDAFIKGLYNKQVSNYADELAEKITEITNVKCFVRVDFSLSRAKINSVTVNFKNSVILPEDEHIFIVESTKEFLESSEKISREIVNVIWT